MSKKANPMQRNQAAAGQAFAAAVTSEPLKTPKTRQRATPQNGSSRIEDGCWALPGHPGIGVCCSEERQTCWFSIDVGHPDPWPAPPGNNNFAAARVPPQLPTRLAYNPLQPLNTRQQMTLGYPEGLRMHSMGFAMNRSQPVDPFPHPGPVDPFGHPGSLPEQLVLETVNPFGYLPTAQQLAAAGRMPSAGPLMPPRTPDWPTKLAYSGNGLAASRAPTAARPPQGQYTYSLSGVTAANPIMPPWGRAAAVCPPFSYDYNGEMAAVMGLVSSDAGPRASETRMINRLTDVAYLVAYPNGPFPIPQGWQTIPNCLQWANTWMRIRDLVKRIGPKIQYGRPRPSRVTPRRPPGLGALARGARNIMRRLGLAG
jgi:hypothetical protein